MSVVVGKRILKTGGNSYFMLLFHTHAVPGASSVCLYGTLFLATPREWMMAARCYILYRVRRLCQY